MGGLDTMFQEHPWALLFGVSGLACQLGWPLMRRRPAILAMQFGVGAAYALHYACLGAWTGAGIAALGATQTCIAMLAGQRPWLGRLGLFFLPLVGLACYLTWCGCVSLLAMTACCLVMLGRLQTDTLHMRYFLLAAAPFGISYDIAVGAAPAMIGAITSASIAALMLAREIDRRHDRSTVRHGLPSSAGFPGRRAAVPS